MKRYFCTLFTFVLFLAPTLAAGQSIDLVDADGNSVASYVEGTRVYVRLTDPSYDVPGTRDTVTVSVSSDVAGDMEDVLLYETGLSTGVFTGSIEMRFAPSPAYPDGYLQTEMDPLFDTVRAYEPMSYAEATASAVPSRTDFVTAAGTPVEAFAGGDAAYVRVEDHRADLSGAPDSVTVTLSSSVGDLESLTLTETTPTSGVFAGSIPIGLSMDPVQPGDGLLEGQSGGPWIAGDSVGVTYTDTQGTTSGDSAELRLAILAFVDSAGSPVADVLAGQDVHVRVLDHLAYFVSVNMTSFHAGDFEYFDVFETSWGSGVWEGSMPLVDAPAYSFNYQLEASPASAGEKLTMDYEGTILEAGVFASRSAFVDGNGNEVALVPMAPPLAVRVTEPAADFDPGSADVVTAVVTSMAESETVQLSETGASTGVFEGTVPIVHGSPASPGDGSLSVEHGESLTVTHQDTNGVTSSSASAVVAARTIELMDAGGNPVEAYQAGDTVYFRLLSLEESNPYYAVWLNGMLRTSAGDEEYVDLIETGVETGVFVGSISSTAGAVSPWDYLLQLTAGDKVTLEYEDYYLEHHNYEPGGKVSDVAGVR